MAIRKLVVCAILAVASLTLQAQTLPAVSAQGYGEIKQDTFQNVTGAQVTLDAQGVNYILVTASFQMEMRIPEESERVAEFRIVDIDDPENINSGIIHRSFSLPKDVDYGIGSIVYIFDVSAFDNKRTYQFQHALENVPRTLSTTATISAIALKSGAYDLLNDCKSLTTPETMTNSWMPIGNLTSDVITTDLWGGFYVAASLDCLPHNFNSEAIAEYKLQYKKNSGAWTDLSSVVRRSMANSTDYGVINLLGYLPDKSSPGSYSFRAMHRNAATASDLKTTGGNLVAVFLGTNGIHYPLITGEANDVSTTSTSLTEIFSVDVSYEVNTDAYLHSHFYMQDSTTIATYDMYVDNSLYDGPDMKKSLENTSEIGVGVSTGIVTGITPGTTYRASVRHATSTSNTLTSSATLVGFYLTAKINLLPVELLSFKVENINPTYNVLTWETATEKSNDYFTLFRSPDGESWSEIARVSGSGNSLTPLVYKVEDDNASSGLCYYKLTQTDYDGSTTELSVVAANSKDIRPIEANVFPNPVEDVLYLASYYDEVDRHVQIVNSVGQILFDKYDSLAGGLDVSNLESGCYILLVDGFKPQAFLKK